jgi:hypothetical protein
MDDRKTLKYQIIPELGLHIDCWFGELTFDKILSSKLEQVNDSLWNQAYNNISDVRNAVFILNDEEAKKIIEYTKVDSRWQYKRKTAYLTENPNQVVFQNLLEMNKSKEIPNEMECFSTLYAALNWLNIDLKEMKRIKEIVEQLSELKLQ